MNSAILNKAKYDDSRFVFSIIVISVIIIFSCTKNPIQENHYHYDAYKQISDWYTLDTVFVNRAILWENDSIWRDETRMVLDTINDMWWRMCATARFPLHIEHWYYMRNGKKIHPSLLPKN